MGSHAADAVSFSFAAAIVAATGSSTPFFTAVISARMETAISGGVRLPMYRPVSYTHLTLPTNREV